MEKLYNTVDSSAELGVVKTNIQTSIKSNIQASLNEANKITPEVVRSAAELLKPDKSDVSQLFSSDVFKHAPQILYDHIAAIFRSYVVHGSIQRNSCLLISASDKGAAQRPEETGQLPCHCRR